MAQPAQTHDVTVENSHFVHRGADGNFRLRLLMGRTRFIRRRDQRRGLAAIRLRLPQP